MLQMAEIAFENGFVTIVTVLVSAALGFLAAQVKRLGKREQAEREILKTIARKEILDTHERYVIKGERMSVERYHEIQSLCSSYTDLGGNGSAKPFIKDLLAVRPYLLTE